MCATAGFIAIVFVNNAYLFWAPKFMAGKFALDVGQAGTQTMLWHHLFALAAIMAGGVVSDRFGTRGFEIGFALMGAAYLVGALLMSISFFFTFRRNRIQE